MNENLPDNVYQLFPGKENSSLPVEPPQDTAPKGDPGGLIPRDRLGVATPTPVENAPPYFSADEVQARARRSHPSQGNIPPA